MKIKTILISLLVTGVAAGGIGYGIITASRSNAKPVAVVPIQNVNYGYWGDSSTMYGSILSMDSQNVQLNSEYELVKVYVETGDEVKIGDPLLEYDMTLTELKNEMEELTMMGLEISLASLEKELKKLQGTTPSASLAWRTGTMTASDDGLLVDEGTVSGNGVPARTIIQDGNNNPGGDLIQDDDSNQGGTGGSSANPLPGETGGQDGNNDPGETQQQPQDSTEDPGDEDQMISDGEENDNDTDAGETPVDDELIDDGSGSDTGDVSPSEDMILQINSFLTRVNQLSSQELDQLIPSDISEALRIFRENLSVQESEETVDVFGDTRTLHRYSVNPEIAQAVGEGTTLVLQQAYDRACVYHLIYCMQQLNPENRPVEDYTEEGIRQLDVQIRTAADAYYALQQGAYTEYEEIITECTNQLSSFVARLNQLDLLEETEPSTEATTEQSPGGFDDFGDYGGLSGGDGITYTAEELREMIREKENSIKECRLQMRESELKLKQFQRQLDQKIVKSTMNGVVKSAGNVGDAVTEENFIVISGASGLYVQGTINELKLDSVKVGDQIQGTSYESGIGFMATITEISPYPVSGDSYYFGYSSENSNASYYPFLAYIEDAEGLMEGDVEIQIVENVPSTGIYLEKYFILEESSGKEYVYIQGEDGLLKKQYVQTGIDVYGAAREIRSGLSLKDKIAFPYGKEVMEGAQTREVDNLFMDNYGYSG